MPFIGDTFAHLFDWEKDPQRQQKIINARLEAEFDGIDTGLSALATSRLPTEMIVKTGNETVNNSTTLQDDNHLLIPIAASETIYFMLNMKYVEDSATNADLKIAFTGPTGVVDGQMVPINGVAINTTDAVAVQGAINIGGGGSFLSVGASTASRYLTLIGYAINGSTAGNVTIQWAQAAAQMHDTFVQQGSFIIVWRP